VFEPMSMQPHTMGGDCQGLRPADPLMGTAAIRASDLEVAMMGA